MKKVVVFGAKGQLGSDCCALLQDQLDVIAVDLPEVDVSHRESCFAVLDQHRPDVVMNCAAFTAVDACETEVEMCGKVNADAPGFMAEWVEANDSFLVHVSTDYVFPGTKPLFESVLEDEATGPVSEYGRAKLLGEQRIAEATERYAILRTAWLYGQHGNNFLKTMLRLTLQHSEKEFKVVNDQFGSPTWSATLARQMVAVAEKKVRGVFHATSEGYGSWYELACAFLEELGVEHHFVPCGTEEYPTPAKRPVNSILENGRLKAESMNCFADWQYELTCYVEHCGAAVLNEVKGMI